MLVVADHLQNHSLMQSCAIPETAICFIVDCHVFNNETSFFFSLFQNFFNSKSKYQPKCRSSAIYMLFDFGLQSRGSLEIIFFLKKKMVLIL